MKIVGILIILSLGSVALTGCGASLGSSSAEATPSVENAPTPTPVATPTPTPTPAALSAPTGLSLATTPLNNAQTPVATWTALTGAIYYQAQILDASLAVIAGPQTLVSGNAISSLSLSPDVLYTFQVRGVDSYGQMGAWASTTWTSYCDSYWSQTKLALELDGANASTVFSDSSTSAVTPLTAAGQAKLSTAQKFNGTASANFDGSGDYITTPTSSDWRISGDYTVEARVYVSSAQLNPILTAVTSSIGWSLAVSATGSIYFDTTNGTSVKAQSAAAAVSTGAWHHVAGVRSGTNLYVYLDGNQVGTAASAHDLTGNYAIWVGGSSTNSFNGYIDDVRITPGVARYTGSTYTVPTKTLMCQ